MPICPRCNIPYPAGRTHCDLDGAALIADPPETLDIDFETSADSATKAESPSGRRVVADVQIISEAPVAAPRAEGPPPASTVADPGTRLSALSAPPRPVTPPAESSDPSARRRDRVRIQAESRIGEMLGSYRLQEVLGAGGMGAVYRAEHVTLGRPVALKLLHRQYAKRRDAVARFFQEAKAVNRIRHKNIVDVTDLVKLPDGTVFIIMELLEGISLGQYLRETGLLSVADTISVVIQICDALRAAHLQHIVHRDLKPDNIFLTTTDDGDLLVKLLDFGVAKLTGDDEQVGHKTAAGSVVGTPAYMSPEQAGALQIDHRSDIYSLGAIMYQLFTGQHVFRGRTFGDYVNKHLNELPEPPRSTPGGVRVDEQLEAIVMRCLEKSPSARFQSAGELREALISYMEQLAADLGTQIESDSGIYRLSGFSSSSPVSPPVGATEVMWPVGSGAGTGSSPGGPPTSLPAARAPHAVETAMAVGDITGTFSGARTGRVALWAGAFALIGSGIVVAAVSSGRSEHTKETTEAQTVAADAGVRVEGPTGPTVTPIEGHDAATLVTTHLESRPAAQLSARGSSDVLCETPCDLTIDPRDGGSPRRRDFVLRAPGYRDAAVSISLTAPEPSYRVELERLETPGVAPDAGTDDDRLQREPSRHDSKKRKAAERRARERARRAAEAKAREREAAEKRAAEKKAAEKRAAEKRAAEERERKRKRERERKRKRRGQGGGSGSGSKVLSPKETLDPFGRKK